MSTATGRRRPVIASGARTSSARGRTSASKRVRRRRPWVAAVVTVIASIVILPAHCVALLVFMTAATSYERDGQGAPFRFCGAAETGCTNPDLGMTLLAVLAIAVGLLVAGWAGQLAGALYPKWRYRFGFAVLSAIVILPGWAIVWGALGG